MDSTPVVAAFRDIRKDTQPRKLDKDTGKELRSAVVDAAAAAVVVVAKSLSCCSKLYWRQTNMALTDSGLDLTVWLKNILFCFFASLSDCFLRPTIRLFCNLFKVRRRFIGCINHDIIIRLCFELIMR